MELKGHNLIIISLDSHFSKMERNVLTRHPLPRLSSPPPTLGKNSRGQRWFTTAVSSESPWPAPIMHSARGGSPAQPLETSAQISANASQIEFAILRSLVKTTPLSVWLLTAGGVKSSTQYKPRPAEPCPAQGPRRPLGSKGLEKCLKLSQCVYFPMFNDIVHARNRTPAPANN